MNAGLPGTGLYDRKKLIDGNLNGVLGGFLKGKLGGGKPDMSNYQLVIEDNGEVEILNENGRAVGAEEAKEIRRRNQYQLFYCRFL